MKKILCIIGVCLGVVFMIYAVNAGTAGGTWIVATVYSARPDYKLDLHMGQMITLENVDSTGSKTWSSFPISYSLKGNTYNPLTSKGKLKCFVGDFNNYNVTFSGGDMTWEGDGNAWLVTFKRAESHNDEESSTTDKNPKNADTGENMTEETVNEKTENAEDELTEEEKQPPKPNSLLLFGDEVQISVEDVFLPTFEDGDDVLPSFTLKFINSSECNFPIPETLNFYRVYYEPEVCFKSTAFYSILPPYEEISIEYKCMLETDKWKASNALESKGLIGEFGLVCTMNYDYSKLNEDDVMGLDEGKSYANKEDENPDEGSVLVEQLSDCCFVTAANLNLRLEPSASGGEETIITTLPAGTLCYGDGSVSEDGNWIYVKAEEYEGWVSCKYVEPLGSRE